MKNIVLVISITIAFFASLEAFGVTHFLKKNKIADKSLFQKSNEDAGGMGIPQSTAKELLTNAKTQIDKDGLKIKYYNYISKDAILDLFHSDSKTTGLLIWPFFENDSIKLLVMNGHYSNQTFSNAGSYAYVIKTFCPEICDEQLKNYH